MLWPGPFGIRGKNLGVTTADGTLTWHIRTLLTVPGRGTKAKPRVHTQWDYFASTTTFLPVKIQVSDHIRREHRVTTTITTLEFSNFGEAVHVTLPAACAPK